jgi:hypothetical protein
MKEMNKQPGNEQVPSQAKRINKFQPPPPMETRTARREMNGPNIDPGLFAGTPLMTNYPKPPNQQQVRIDEEFRYEDDDRFSIASSSELSMGSLDSDISLDTPKRFSIQKKPTKFKKGNKGLELNIE